MNYESSFTVNFVDNHPKVVYTGLIKQLKAVFMMIDLYNVQKNIIDELTIVK